ncbi:MAG: hypothetical protein AVDCRST_MAG59-1429, partial [uncultured Thermomicrobiales bacterium]
DRQHEHAAAARGPEAVQPGAAAVPKGSQAGEAAQGGKAAQGPQRV